MVIANLSRQIVEQGRLKQELNSDLLAVYGIPEGGSKSSCFYLSTNWRKIPEFTTQSATFLLLHELTRWLFIVLKKLFRAALPLSSFK